MQYCYFNSNILDLIYFIYLFLAEMRVGGYGYCIFAILWYNVIWYFSAYFYFIIFLYHYIHFIERKPT